MLHVLMQEHEAQQHSVEEGPGEQLSPCDERVQQQDHRVESGTAEHI